MSQITLTAEELSTLEKLKTDGKYPEMYQYLRSIALRERNSSLPGNAQNELGITANWLNVAGEINGDGPTFSNYLVRGSMKAAAAFNGWLLTNEQFQRASDDLAIKVGKQVLDAGAIPAIESIIKSDVSAAVDGLGLETWNWAGTLGDSLPAALGGLGQDFVQIPGSDLAYAKNVTIALGQNIAGVSNYLSNHEFFNKIPMWALASEIQKFAADNQYKVFAWFSDDAPAQGAPQFPQHIDISIDPSPPPKHLSTEEEQAHRDVANGYTHNSSTHSVRVNGDLLNKTDFVSSQMAGLTSGGIRPGEVQVDPNIRPGNHLAQFYADQPIPNKPDFSLRNALVLNGLSTMAAFNTYVDPLLLDLTGNGISITGLEDAVLFDIDNSGRLRRSGWADANTGMLVIDNGSGQIANISQMFSEYYKGEAGDAGQPGERKFKDGFAALASEETVVDGMINNQDAIWPSLRVWVDASHDAHVDPGELKTLEELGISQINLGTAGATSTLGENGRILAQGSFVIHGHTREALAVQFQSDVVSSSVTPQGNGIRIETSSAHGATSAYNTAATVDETLDATVLNVDNVYGGSGNDTLIAATTGSWLVGGPGSNTYIGSAADDVFVISASDVPANIQGNGGRDTALIVGDSAVTLDMAKAGLTVAQAGRGADIIRSGGVAGVFIKGGSGNSTLIGGAGNDVLSGGSGHNTLVGGSGRAVIHAGPSGDLIIASRGGSIIHAGGGEDRIHGREGNDVIKAGRGNAIIDGGGGLNLVSLQGSYSEYTITRQQAGYQIADRVPGRNGTLSLQNIQKLDFADISSIDLALPNAMPVPDVLRVDHLGNAIDRYRPALVSAAALLANDQLLGSAGGLRVAYVEDAVGGTAALTDDGNVLFTPDARFTGAMSFKYSIADAADNHSAEVIDLVTGERAPMRAMVTLLDASQPGDPLFAKQWYLSQTNVLPVWADYDGKGVRIAMFEPGGEFAVGPEIFDVQHPDLAPNVDPAWLKGQLERGTLAQLASNHATQVAGVMVAARNDAGAVGVAHGATLAGYYLANKGDDLTGLGNMVNYDVANHSWSFGKDFAVGNLAEGAIDTHAALAVNARYAAHNGRGGLGTAIVTAGGNQRAAGGNAQGSPTNSNRFSIQVAAINAQGDLSTLQAAAKPFSNPGASLLVAAPGSNVLSTSRMLETEQGSTFGNHYSSTNGTSFAAPIVSGIIALMLQANPNLGYRDIQQILAISARQLVDAQTDWADNHARNWNGAGMHVSHDYGFGEVDARAAVRLAESWTARSTGANEKQLAVASGPLALDIAPGTSVRHVLPLGAGVQVEHVEVDFGVDVGRLGDLVVRLVSPGGTESVLLDRQGKVPAGTAGASDVDRGDDRSGPFKYTFMTTFARGEQSAGEWALQVTNADNGLPVNVERWGVRVTGREATLDDTYFFTDEYAQLTASNPQRATLDDATHGIAGGRNTLNAAAVSGDVVLDLGSSQASIAGTPLTLDNPANLHNLIAGDGNDQLIAGAAAALIDGGRGHNTLGGGAGQDLFVIHRRANGADTVQNFDSAAGDRLALVGFAAKSLAELQPIEQEAALKFDLGAGQALVLQGTSLHAINDSHFIFQDSFSAPASYIDSEATTGSATLTTGTVVLNGGGGSVSFSSGADGQFVFALSGTVYSRDEAASDRFVITHQPGKHDYGNALRGYRDGADKIDLSLVGVTGFDQLLVTDSQRGIINDIAQIHGVELSTPVGAEPGKSVKLLYLDAVEAAQMDASDFIFASTVAPEPQADQLIQAMAAFGAQPSSVSSFAVSQLEQRQPLLAANWS